MILRYSDDKLSNKMKIEFQPKVLSLSNVYLNYKHPRSLHKHENHLEITFVYDGKGIYQVDDKIYEVKQGDIIICNKDILHDEPCDSQSNFARYCLSINNIKLDGLDSNCIIDDKKCPVFSSKLYYVYLKSIFDIMFVMMNDKNLNMYEEYNHLSKVVLSIVMEIVNNNDDEFIDMHSDDLYSEVKKYIDENFHSELTLVNIAKIFSVSQSYLSHMFKKKSGYSVVNYIIRRRIGEAQTLLITTNKSITDIAIKVGYSHVTNFNIAFSKYIGISPSQYRKTYVLR